MSLGKQYAAPMSLAVGHGHDLTSDESVLTARVLARAHASCSWRAELGDTLQRGGLWNIAAWSRPFHAMFTLPMLESRHQCRVVIEDAEHKHLLVVLDYIYSG